MVATRPVLARAVVVLVALAGCAPQASRADGAAALADVRDHLEQAASAVETARLAVETTVEGRLPAVTADATLISAVGTANDATQDLATVVPPAAEEAVARARDDALRAASGAVEALARTRVALGSPQPDTALPALDDAAAAIEQALAGASG